MAPSLASGQGGGELRVGALFPAASLLGDESLRGLELAVEARGGTRLLRGEAADAAQGVAEARRLVQQERCTLLFGSANTAVALAASQAAEALDAIYVELASAADALTERSARLLVRAGPGAADFGRLAGEALTRFLPNQLSQPVDALRVAIIHEANPSAESIAAACESRLREDGLTVAERLAHVPRTTEMAALLQRMRAAGISVLLHAGAESDAAALLRALEELAWRPSALLGLGAGWGLLDLAQAPGLEGCYAMDVPPIASAAGWAPGAKPFAEAYQRRWGSAPRSGVSLAAFAVAKPVLAAPQRPAMGVLDLEEGTLANGWGFRLNDRGQNLRAAPVLSQWRQGRPVAVWPPAAAFSPP